MRDKPYTGDDPENSPMRPELAQAVGLLRSDAPDEIEKAIELLQNTVFSFSMKVCGHREDAEDTMQEVLYRSLRNLARIEDPSALAVWLYTVTRNRCWRMRRKGSLHAKQISLDELMPGEKELERLLQDSAPGPDKRLLKAEEQRILQKAVLQLPPQLRIVLVLHDMEELTTDEVSQVLGLRAGTVRVRLHRARLILRKEVDAQVAKRVRKTAGKKPPGKNARSGKRPAECRNLFRNLSEYLDGRIDAPDCDRMREHIEACPACVAFISDLRSAIDRCKSVNTSCSSATARRLRSLLTREYLRMLETDGKEKN
jgi:RNA polymerase sigma-70 factor (ECF subfamily)